MAVKGSKGWSGLDIKSSIMERSCSVKVGLRGYYKSLKGLYSETVVSIL